MASLVDIPDGLFGYAYSFFGAKEILRCSSLSREMRSKSLTEIATSPALLSTIVSKFFRHYQQEPLAHFLDACRTTNPTLSCLSLHLTIDARHMDQQLQRMLDLTSTFLPKIERVTFTHSRGGGT